MNYKKIMVLLIIFISIIALSVIITNPIAADHGGGDLREEADHGDHITCIDDEDDCHRAIRWRSIFANITHSSPTTGHGTLADSINQHYRSLYQQIPLGNGNTAYNHFLSTDRYLHQGGQQDNVWVNSNTHFQLQLRGDSDRSFGDILALEEDEEQTTFDGGSYIPDSSATKYPPDDVDRNEVVVENLYGFVDIPEGAKVEIDIETDDGTDAGYVELNSNGLENAETVEDVNFFPDVESTYNPSRIPTSYFDDGFIVSVENPIGMADATTEYDLEVTMKRTESNLEKPEDERGKIRMYNAMFTEEHLSAMRRDATPFQVYPHFADGLNESMYENIADERNFSTSTSPQFEESRYESGELSDSDDNVTVEWENAYADLQVSPHANYPTQVGIPFIPWKRVISEKGEAHIVYDLAISTTTEDADDMPIDANPGDTTKNYTNVTASYDEHLQIDNQEDDRIAFDTVSVGYSQTEYDLRDVIDPVTFNDVDMSAYVDINITYDIITHEAQSRTASTACPTINEYEDATDHLSHPPSYSTWVSINETDPHATVCSESNAGENPEYVEWEIVDEEEEEINEDEILSDEINDATVDSDLENDIKDEFDLEVLNFPDETRLYVERDGDLDTLWTRLISNGVSEYNVLEAPSNASHISYEESVPYVLEDLLLDFENETIDGGDSNFEDREAIPGEVSNDIDVYLDVWASGYETDSLIVSVDDEVIGGDRNVDFGLADESPQIFENIDITEEVQGKEEFEIQFDFDEEIPRNIDHNTEVKYSITYETDAEIGSLSSRWDYQTVRDTRWELLREYSSDECDDDDCFRQYSPETPYGNMERPSDDNIDIISPTPALPVRKHVLPSTQSIETFEVSDFEVNPIDSEDNSFRIPITAPSYSPHCNPDPRYGDSICTVYSGFFANDDTEEDLFEPDDDLSDEYERPYSDLNDDELEDIFDPETEQIPMRQYLNADSVTGTDFDEFTEFELTSNENAAAFSISGVAGWDSTSFDQESISTRSGQLASISAEVIPEDDIDEDEFEEIQNSMADDNCVITDFDECFISGIDHYDQENVYQLRIELTDENSNPIQTEDSDHYELITELLIEEGSAEGEITTPRLNTNENGVAYTVVPRETIIDGEPDIRFEKERWWEMSQDKTVYKEDEIHYPPINNPSFDGFSNMFDIIFNIFILFVALSFIIALVTRLYPDSSMTTREVLGMAFTLFAPTTKVKKILGKLIFWIGLIFAFAYVMSNVDPSLLAPV